MSFGELLCLFHKDTLICCVAFLGAPPPQRKFCRGGLCTPKGCPPAHGLGLSSCLFITSAWCVWGGGVLSAQGPPGVMWASFTMQLLSERVLWHAAQFSRHSLLEAVKPEDLEILAV